MIGHGQSEAQRHAIAQNNYRNEAMKISQHISTLHPSRSHKQMQVQYPATIQRLSSDKSDTNIRSIQPRKEMETMRASTLRRGERTIGNTDKNHFFLVENENEFHTRRQGELKQEYSLNDRKKRFNRSCGTHAVVSDVC
jgi:hypothetical protein